MSDAESYSNPLIERYASAEMAQIFSARFKFETWRRLWLWLAEEEKRLGLPIPEQALVQMRGSLGQIDFYAPAREN
jgi:adenylosuccinate lyase